VDQFGQSVADVVMGKDPCMLALDSNAMTYFIDAMAGLPNEPVESEWIALIRIFLWMPSEACFRLTATVEAECRAIPDQAKLDGHLSWVLSHLSGVRPHPDSKAVESRSSELAVYHTREKDRKDCLMVAECELAGLSALLTLENNLLNHLRMQTPVWIARPSQFWDWMWVARGYPPIRTPANDNPLAQCAWWHW
jgi:hypothetical protein